MSQPSEPRRVRVALVITADSDLDGRVGELVPSGYRLVWDTTCGAAGESIRRVRPDAAVLDPALPQSVIDACLLAADEVRCPSVLLLNR